MLRVAKSALGCSQTVCRPRGLIQQHTYTHTSVLLTIYHFKFWNVLAEREKIPNKMFFKKNNFQGISKHTNATRAFKPLVIGHTVIGTIESSRLRRKLLCLIIVYKWWSTNILMDKYFWYLFFVTVRRVKEKRWWQRCVSYSREIE